MRTLLLLHMALLVLATGAVAADPARPNVLLIAVDDLKPLLGCYGDPQVKTPHLDRLAKRGMRFTSAYCNQAVCSPSRNALMTGLRPQTLGIYDLETNFRKAVPDAVTLSQHFMRHGYRAETIGKIYHTGHGNGDDAASWSVPALKPNGGGKVATYHDPANRPGKDARQGAPWECIDVADEAYLDGAIAGAVVERLRAAKGGAGQPLFLALGFIRPHLPFVAPKRYWDLYQRSAFTVPSSSGPLGAPPYGPHAWGELRQYQGVPAKEALSDEQARTMLHGYHAAVSYLDAQVGKVLDALDDTGLAARTVVVLWGDHGWHLGDHGMWCKHTNYEQAARIPLIIAGPGVAVGAASDALIETVDLYPTLSALAGLPAPTGLDGLSQLAVLNRGAAPRDHIIHVYPRGERIGRAIRTARHRLVEWKKPGTPGDAAVFELYDYQADPQETKNLAAEQPQVVAELRVLLARHPEAKPQITGK